MTVKGRGYKSEQSMRLAHQITNTQENMGDNTLEKLRLELAIRQADVELAKEKRLLVEAEAKSKEKRGEKRKRSKKVKDKGKEKVKEKEKEKEVNKSSPPDKKRTRYGVTVANPLTRNKVTISDLSHKNNRVMFNIIQQVREEQKKGESVEKYDALVKMIAEALKKGLKAPFYDPMALPDGVLNAAKGLVSDEVGDEVFESGINTGTDFDTLETFHGDFNHQSITSDNWPGESFQNDLAFIRPCLEAHLQQVLRAHKRIRFFLTYKCLMAKTRMNLVKGETNGTHHLEEVEESRVANIKSGYMQSLSMANDIPDLVDAAFLTLDAEMEKYTENGSGFRWIKSISMDPIVQSIRCWVR